MDSEKRRVPSGHGKDTRNTDGPAERKEESWEMGMKETKGEGLGEVELSAGLKAACREGTKMWQPAVHGG